MIIGVLALQGSVQEHSEVVLNNDDQLILVKEPNDLNNLDGLIIPGGESTTLSKLLKIKSLDVEISKAYKKGLTIWGTCAGLILLSKELTCKSLNPLGLIDIIADRNSYGSQIDSFNNYVEFIGEKSNVSFIRAPKISSVGKDVETLVTFNGSPVAARNRRVMVTAFHPEVTNNNHFYSYFKNMILES